MVAENPMLVLWFIFSPVLTGFSHNISPGLSGTPSGCISSTMIGMSAPSSYALTTSPSELV